MSLAWLFAWCSCDILSCTSVLCIISWKDTTISQHQMFKTMYVCMYACVNICMYVCIHVCVMYLRKAEFTLPCWTRCLITVSLYFWKPALCSDDAVHLCGSLVSESGRAMLQSVRSRTDQTRWRNCTLSRSSSNPIQVREILRVSQTSCVEHLQKELASCTYYF